MRRLAIAGAILAGCGGEPRALSPNLIPTTPGSIAKSCGNVEFWVTGGTPNASCTAIIDDQSQRLVALQCDDGKGNDAKLSCGKDDRVGCVAHGSGLCAADANSIKPGIDKPARFGYFAYRCGTVPYFVAPGFAPGGKGVPACAATFDRATGTKSMNCDDGAGDTTSFVCRDGIGACTATGSAICTPDETVVRK